MNDIQIENENEINELLFSFEKVTLVRLADDAVTRF